MASRDSTGADAPTSPDWPEPAAHSHETAVAFWERFALGIGLTDPAHVRLAWFDLNQAAEFALKSILFAMTHRAPECHDLRLLSRLVAKYTTRVNS